MSNLITNVVRTMAEAMLTRKMGYRVFTASDGFEAVEAFKERKADIGLVLLDLSMPGMNGWDTLSALRGLAFRYSCDSHQWL